MTLRNLSGIALLIAAIWLGHSVILLFLEPGMGFHELADYFDLARVVPALGSIVWFVSNTLHVAMGVALLFFQSALRQAGNKRHLLAADAGIVTAPLFVVVGMSGFVGQHLVEILRTDRAALDASLYGLLAVRTYIMTGAIALYGLMVVAISLRADNVAVWMRALGTVVGLAGIVFVLIPLPVPVLFLAWSVAFSVWNRKQAPHLPGSD